MVEFSPTTVYTIDELRNILPCTPETFLERLAIPRRLNGIVLGSDICAAMERCARDTLEGIQEAAPVKSSPLKRKPRKAVIQALEPLNPKSILAQRNDKRS